MDMGKEDRMVKEIKFNMKMVIAFSLILIFIIILIKTYPGRDISEAPPT